jgi:VWFA-related protein
MKLTKLSFALATLSLAALAQTPASPRLLCMFLDLNALNAADLATAQDSGVKFIQQQMTPADRVSIMTNSSRGLNVLQDFTGDRDALVSVLRALMPSGTAPSNDASSRLEAIRQAAAVLGNLPERKAMLYFGSGVTNDNQADLRATVNELIRANISVYPVDARGLIPTPR